MSIQTILEDILDDALAGLAAAANIFVKNPAHQATASAAVSALSSLVQSVDSQINGATSTSTTTTTTATA